MVTFAAEQRTPITGSVPTLNETSFVNAYAGGGANVENTPLIQREQIQRAANKWNVEIVVIGIIARGSAGYGSDWDCIVNEIKPKMLHDMRFRLPKSELSRGDLGRARLEIWKGTIKKDEAHITFKPFRN
ncbi:hypothetical protein SAMN05444360_1068 [Chryseobacterium carnipullorum]|uniref:hypothetical protein n=1 Tax=Chryseobacterium carnipullorum TaxID=1124835 RepID=UPI0009143CC2|nr:hypothetical protein [Chryseobacterium carnipullorum]SHL92522.1 hypothetical protein SAMN05444360_1068 [Chryseobacterium carnipullorum]